MSRWALTILSCFLVLVSASALAQDGAGYIVQQATLLDGFEAGSNWSVIGTGDMAFDSTHVQEGGSSLKMTTPLGDEMLARKSVNLDFSNVTTFSFWVYIEEPQQWNQAAIVGLAFTGDNWKSDYMAHTEDLRQGWNKVNFSRADFALEGSGTDWNKPITGVEMRLYDMGWTSTAYFDQLTYGQYTRPKVVVSFDDGWDSTYLYGYQYMKKYGMKGTAYITSSFVGQNQRVTIPQISEMYNYGWDISNHTTTHPDLTTLTADQIDQEVMTCNDFLVANGWTRNNCHLHFAYPYGRYNSDSMLVMANEGMLTARTTWTARQANVLDEKYLLYTQIPDGTIDTLDQVKTRVDNFVKAGGMMEFLFHKVVTGTPAAGTEWQDTNFYAIIDYLATLQSQGLIDVVTITDWYAGLSGATLTSFTINPNIVTGTQGSTGTVTLKDPAPDGGISVTLTNPWAVIKIPQSITIPAGAKSATFPISTFAVASSSNFPLKASLNGVTLAANIRILQAASNPTISGLSIVPNTVVGGNTTTGTVTLNGAAPSGGEVVMLNSSDTATQVPASVTVPAGAITATFTVTTTPVAVDAPATVTGTTGAASKTDTLTVLAPTISAMTIVPNSVQGGTGATGTVTLNGAAPFMGMTVALSSSNVAAQVPVNVTVAADGTTATFSITTTAVAANVTSTITGTTGQVSKSDNLTVLAPALSLVVLVPNSVVGGTSAAGTVSLTGLAPTGGLVVKLTSNNSNAVVPASVTVAAGTNTKSFTATTKTVAATVTATITATLGGVSKTDTLTVLPKASLSSFTLSPSTVVGGNSSTGTVTLTAAAPTGGMVVTLSLAGNAGIPGHVTVPAGTNKVTFTVTTTHTSYARSAGITASVGSSSKLAILTINP